ncbi:hypothetical protein FLA_5967 [Filimonas lacunae]|nr:hypothetical protein FLA_5967 [Filimonas lacunae]
MPVFFSCATYHERAQSYYDGLQTNNYQQAERSLDKNKLIQARRNRLLYYMEKGYVSHLLHQYDTSNTYFNLADNFTEGPRNGAWDIAVGTLTNPMMQTYRGEDFEIFLVHYYKALNYLYLGKKEDALVEARRITLSNNEQRDKFNDKSSRYSQDAFALIIQGLLYEGDNDINNAFISYRNAADLFLRQPNHTYYGVALPLQLQQDLLRMATLLGFTDQVTEYQQKLGISYQAQPVSDGGELVLFLENGTAPYKKQDDYFFTLIKNEAGFFFTNSSKLITVPVNFSVGIDASKLSVSDFNVFRLAMPSYVVRPLANAQFSVTVDSVAMGMVNTIEDINYIATNTLSERALKDISLALSRLLVKKIAEKQVKDKNQTAGDILQAVNLLVEKADTRNWQSLPAQISYIRVPLKKGENKVEIKTGGNTAATITVQGNGGLQFYNYRRMQ